MCQHTYFHGRCRNELSGLYCETGRRTRTYFVLSGSVLSVWPVVEEVLEGSGEPGHIGKRISRMQVIRVKTVQDQKIVGTHFFLPEISINIYNRARIDVNERIFRNALFRFLQQMNFLVCAVLKLRVYGYWPGCANLYSFYSFV